MLSPDGALSLFFKPHRGVFLWTARPAPPWGNSSFPGPKKKKEITTARQMLGGDGNGWKWLSYFKREVVSEEGEGLSREGGYGAFFITRSARRIRSTVLNWPQLNKWRQKYRPRQHSRSRKFKGFNWKWLLLVRNELLIRKTLQRGESLILSRPLHLWYT